MNNLPGGMFGGGQMPQFGQLLAMLQQHNPDDEQKQRHGGMNPMMAMSPLLGMFMSGHPNLGLGMISPGLGIARALGAFK